MVYRFSCDPRKDYVKRGKLENIDIKEEEGQSTFHALITPHIFHTLITPLLPAQRKINENGMKMKILHLNNKNAISP